VSLTYHKSRFKDHGDLINKETFRRWNERVESNHMPAVRQHGPIERRLARLHNQRDLLKFKQIQITKLTEVGAGGLQHKI
jgi:hypothetical protein